MNRRIVRLTALAVMIGVVMLTSSMAMAKPEFPVFQSVETFCSSSPAEEAWFAGNTVHGRNALYTSIIESSNPSLNGHNTIHTNWNINLNTMKGVGWGTWVGSSAGSSDGWYGTYNSEMYIALPLVLMAPYGDPLWLNNGKVVGHGTGQYQGMLIKTEFYSSVSLHETEPPPTDYPCWTGRTTDGYYFVLQSVHTGYIVGQ